MDKKTRWKIQSLLRKLRLLNFVDHIRYIVRVLKNYRKNKAFEKAHPGVVFPPQYLAFDAYSAPEWEYYYNSGKSIAKDFSALIHENLKRKENLQVLEWGCGPGRIIRHLSEHLDPSAKIFGCDYNQDTIAWNRKHISGVEFKVNHLKPPLEFEAGMFDFIYAFSVFTHLSEASCRDWFREMQRVLKAGGYFLFTTQSDFYYEYLLPEEQKGYRSHGFVERGNMTEGKKMFGSYISPEFIQRHFLSGFEIVGHYLPGRFAYIAEQDVWLVKKQKA